MTPDPYAPSVEVVGIDGGRNLYLFTFPNAPEGDAEGEVQTKKGPPEAESDGQLLG